MSLLEIDDILPEKRVSFKNIKKIVAEVTSLHQDELQRVLLSTIVHWAVTLVIIM